mmetsp:Transcript_84502/g.273653  ORF Transcript_84502/g.273653 Transcript_84502/m.273653 type:complete len:422 (+) Transcript_84502:227-1492(+)
MRRRHGKLLRVGGEGDAPDVELPLGVHVLGLADVHARQGRGLAPAPQILRKLDVVCVGVREVQHVEANAVFCQSGAVQHHLHATETPVRRQRHPGRQHVGGGVVQAHVRRVFGAAEQKLSAPRICDGVKVLIQVDIRGGLSGLRPLLVLAVRCGKSVVPLPRTLDVAKALDGALLLAGADVPEEHLARQARCCTQVVAPRVECEACHSRMAQQRLDGTLVGIEVPHNQLAIPAPAYQLAWNPCGRRELQSHHLRRVGGQDLKHVASLNGPDIDRVLPARGARCHYLATGVHSKARELGQAIRACEGPEVSVAQQVVGADRAVPACTHDRVALRCETEGNNRRCVLRKRHEAQATPCAEDLDLAVIAARCKQPPGQRAGLVLGLALHRGQGLLPADPRASGERESHALDAPMVPLLLEDISL